MPIPVKIAAVTIDGVAYEGIYYVQGSVVCVESPFGAKAIQVGKLPPDAIAKMLLSELVRASDSTD
jgi:hypothetical protein